MELPGSAYLYTLAAISMTFAGFCAIVIVLRQTVGKGLSGFHLWLTRLYVESGFWAVVFSLLPPFLALCEFRPATVWRISSAVIAVVWFIYGATYPRRRRAIVSDPLPLKRWLPIAIVSALATVALLGNMAGFPFQPGIAPVAFAATWTLICGAGTFVLALDSFWDA